MNDRDRAGFTKTGFSKAGFSCCGRFSVCEMGKKSCFYAETDTEVKDYCSCYLRNHTNDQVQEESAEQNNEQLLDLEQLSLF